ncbi:hypothetical protein AVEN_238439-1 [Araneus ventricosus]|uniref:MATH domain-containing protein n=1 Tax=Araneus ventricosus TaxID=182803 RepID=A0A4Y2PBD1_ARAVE|nr:hypothetical protein AVEN_238439-1 [Araneus ventricosus]
MRSPLLFEKLNGRFPSGVEGISKMTALASYPEEECFSVYWKIKNFSYCCKEITSPEFSVSGGLYRLNLDSEPTQVVYEVFGSYYDHLGTSTIQISFLTCDGSPEESTSGGQYVFLQVPKDVIFGKRRSAFLPEDTLTVRFRSLTDSETGKVFIYSQIGVKRRHFLWTLKDFSKFERNPSRNLKAAATLH